MSRPRPLGTLRGYLESFVNRHYPTFLSRFLRPPQRFVPMTARVAMALALSMSVVGCGGGSDSALPPADGGATVSPGVAVEVSTEAALQPLDDQAEKITDEELATIAGLIERGRTGPARIRLKKFNAEHGESMISAFLWGLTYHREKKYDRAVAGFAHATEIESRYSLPYYFSGWAHFYLGNLAESRASFLAHLSLRSDTADSHFGVGLIDLEDNLLDAAEQRFRKAIELESAKSNPSPRDMAKQRVRLADVFVQREQFEEARKWLEESVALFEDHYEAHFKLARVLARLGEEELARQAMERHLEIKQRVRPGTAFPEK